MRLKTATEIPKLARVQACLLAPPPDAGAGSAPRLLRLLAPTTEGAHLVDSLIAGFAAAAGPVGLA